MEIALAAHLDPDWALRPIEIVRGGGEAYLLLEDPGAEPLDTVWSSEWTISERLRIAVSIAHAISRMHQRGLVHRNLKPQNIFIGATRSAWLTGFGLATVGPSLSSNDVVSGTLPYIAPEQTGRLERSTDRRSDLYSLGVILFQLFLGRLPFQGSTPLGWIHSHLAEEPVIPVGNDNCPEQVAHIVMRLLRKAPEERYQTAAALESDLKVCQLSLSRTGSIDTFVLGERDTPTKLPMPPGLYGRREALLNLESAWQRVIKTGEPELILVSGPAGAGKSTLIDRFRAAAMDDGVVVAGKCDQQQQTVPYFVLTQALRQVVHRALGLEQVRSRLWGDRLREAIGPNGQLMADLVQGLDDLVGPMPRPVHLPPLEAKNRFDFHFADFLGTASSIDGPLLLILDDLQWIDRPSAALLERILAGHHVRHLLIVGSYRSDEVPDDHAVHRLAQSARDGGVRVSEIKLQELGVSDMMKWIVDTTAIAPETAADLAKIVVKRTGGNPLSVKHFLSTLIDRNLLTFSETTGMWIVDTAGAQGLAATDNLLSLLLVAINRLPSKTQDVLQALACLGARWPLPRLAKLLKRDPDWVLAEVRIAVEEGLVVVEADEIRFVHDRIREAAYAQISAGDRGQRHLMLARALVQLDDPNLLFETVHQINLAETAITSHKERQLAADLNLAAARRSMDTMGHGAAEIYLTHGRTFLGEQGLTERPDVAFTFSVYDAECRLLTGDHVRAEAALAVLRAETQDLLRLATVCCLEADLFTMVGRFEDAVTIGINYLRSAGFDCPRSPSFADVRSAAQQLMELHEFRTIESLDCLPEARDPVHAATMDLITKVLPAALYTNRNLHSLLVLWMTTRTLKVGPTAQSGIALIMLSRIFGPVFSDYQTGFRFAKLGFDLIEANGPASLKPIARLCFAVFCNSWVCPIDESAAILKGAIEAAQVCGDRTYTVYGHNNLFANHFFSGRWLGETERVAEDGLAFSRKVKFALGEAILTVQRNLIAALRGGTPGLTVIADSEAAEAQLRQELESATDFDLPLCWYWIRKLQACVIAGDVDGALHARQMALPLLWVSEEFLEEAEFHLYGAIAVEMGTRVGRVSRSHGVIELDFHLRKLQTWSETCPPNFACRAALVAAERASLQGDVVLAQQLYEAALEAARADDFPNVQAVIAEAAHRHYSDCRLATAAKSYLTAARDAYARWGATQKVLDLEASDPSTGALRSSEHVIQTSWRSMDLESVLRASQALSREILVDDITRTLLHIVLEHAGGDRALLLLCHGTMLRPVAEARKLSGETSVLTESNLETPVSYPEMVARLVLRTKESFVLSDPHSEPDAFGQDDYISSRRPRSVLAVPLMKQGLIIGLLYVENTKVPDVFTPSAVSTLNLLAPQVAISLENARLYADLVAEVDERQKVEAALRSSEAMLSLGEAISQTGSWRWNIATGKATWSAQLYTIMELDPSGPEPQADDILLRVHPEERADILAAHATAVAELREFNLEYRVVLPTGTIKNFVAIGKPDLQTSGADYVGVVVDVTERRRVDEALRDTQAKLAHAGRLTTMGELAASIAHEVNQPITAMIANGNACLRWLNSERFNLARAQESAQRIIADGRRAADIITGIRSMARNSPPAFEALDVNGAARDVLALLAREARKRRVRLSSMLTPALPLIRGDRTQLQQVFVNLVMNGLEALEGRATERRLSIQTYLNETSTVVISFEDNGPGIAPDEATRIFQPFYTTKSNGVGMGLAICRSIATAHGGSLTFTPANPAGTVFRLHLPIEQLSC
jgi:predicted ATPase/signal transduction histidine kinase